MSWRSMFSAGQHCSRMKLPMIFPNWIRSWSMWKKTDWKSALQLRQERIRRGWQENTRISCVSGITAWNANSEHVTIPVRTARLTGNILWHLPQNWQSDTKIMTISLHGIFPMNMEESVIARYVRQPLKTGWKTNIRQQIRWTGHGQPHSGVTAITILIR